MNLAENNFKSFRNAVLKRRLKSKEDYSALFFCPLFKEGESKSLEFDVEFLDKFSLNSSQHEKSVNLLKEKEIYGERNLVVSGKSGHIFKINEPLQNI